MQQYLARFEDIVGIILVNFLIILSALQVFSRYVLNHPLGWTEELVRYVFIWSIFWGAAIVMRHREHVAVQLFHESLPPTGKRVINIFNNLCILAFFAIVLPPAVWYATYAYRLKAVITEIPMFFVYVSFPVGGVLMAVHCFLDIREDLSRIRRGSGE